MRIDKKNSGPEKKIVILSRIGATYEQKATVVRDSLISKTLSEAARVIPGVPKNHPVKMSTPGSKSISNRVLVLAALGTGTCRLRNLLHSDDTQVMMAALNELKVILPNMRAYIHLIKRCALREPDFPGKKVARSWSLKEAKVLSLCRRKIKNFILETLGRLRGSLPPCAPLSKTHLVSLRNILLLPEMQG
jgi:hypothetical protein